MLGVLILKFKYENKYYIELKESISFGVNNEIYFIPTINFIKTGRFYEFNFYLFNVYFYISYNYEKES